MDILLAIARKHWRLLVELGLLLIILLLWNAWQSVKTEYIQYGAGVEALGKQALADKDRDEAAHKANLKEVKDAFEKKLPEITAGAVAAYRAEWLRRSPGGGAVRQPAACQPSDDGAGREPLPDQGCNDAEFIQRAARDAARLEQWRTWCILNRCPVE